MVKKALRAGGMRLLMRLVKPVPVLGWVVAAGRAGYGIRKKGVVPGMIDLALNVLPVVGTAKGVIEIFTGDLIKDRDGNRR